MFFCTRKNGLEFFLVLFWKATSFGLLFTKFIGNCRLWQHSCLRHLQRRILRSILKITILLQWEWTIPQYTYIMFVWMRYNKMLVDSKFLWIPMGKKKLGFDHFLSCCRSRASLRVTLRESLVLPSLVCWIHLFPLAQILRLVFHLLYHVYANNSTCCRNCFLAC